MPRRNPDPLSEVLNVRVTFATAVDLDKIATVRNLSTSDLMREIIVKYLVEMK